MTIDPEKIVLDERDKTIATSLLGWCSGVTFVLVLQNPTALFTGIWLLVHVMFWFVGKISTTGTNMKALGGAAFYSASVDSLNIQEKRNPAPASQGGSATAATADAA